MPNLATVKSVIFATLCSKPVEKNANRHQKIMKSFAVSDFVRYPDHTAKQTRMLHKIPLINNSSGAAVTFAIAAVPIANSVDHPFRPLSWINKANTRLPAKFPSQHAAHNFNILFVVI